MITALDLPNDLDPPGTPPLDLPNDPPGTPPLLLADALPSVEAELAALPRDEIVPHNLGIRRAVAIVLAALPALRATRTEIAARLGAGAAAPIDDLERYALAALGADIESRPPADGQRVAALFAEARALAEEMRAHARSLAAKGILDRVAVRGMTRGRGFLGTANALLAPVILIRMSWADIEGKTPIEPQDLDRAERVARDLCAQAGRRVSRGRAALEEDDRPARALTLLVRAYDDVRQAVAFVRWKHGDVDTIAPSLYIKRRAPRARGEPPPAAPAEPA